MPYKAKDLLHLSDMAINGGTIAAVGGDGVHLVAYVGDADGNGSYGSNDAVLITRVDLQADVGFAAYSLVDPVLVADLEGAGFIPADAALQVSEASVGLPTAPGSRGFAFNVTDSAMLVKILEIGTRITTRGD